MERANRGRSPPVLGRRLPEGVRSKARSPTGLLGASAGAPGDPPGLPRTTTPLGWQPSRFLADRAEAKRAFQLAEQLGSVNAAAAELGTTWPSLGKAFTRHGLGVPARNPEAVRQRRHRRRPPTHRQALPAVDPVFVTLNPAPSPPGAITG